MEITRKSMLSGKVHTLSINVKPEQIRKWQEGELIQDAMPNITPSEREFIMTGITKEEWDLLFKKADE